VVVTPLRSRVWTRRYQWKGLSLNAHAHCFTRSPISVSVRLVCESSAQYADADRGTLLDSIGLCRRRTRWRAHRTKPRARERSSAPPHGERSSVGVTRLGLIRRVSSNAVLVRYPDLLDTCLTPDDIRCHPADNFGAISRWPSMSAPASDFLLALAVAY